jgi:hypothetical protein
MGNKKAVRTEYLIVGNSAGGIGAAEAIRQFSRPFLMGGGRKCLSLQQVSPSLLLGGDLSERLSQFILFLGLRSLELQVSEMGKPTVK